MGQVEVNVEPVLFGSHHQRRFQNLLSSPLLRLPTELIINISEHTIESDDDLSIGDERDDGDFSDDDSDGGYVYNCGLPAPESSLTSPLVLTAICYKLRKIGMATPHLWGTVNLNFPRLATLFLERCGYEPHTLKISAPTRVSMCLATSLQVAWAQVQGCAFDNLRSLVFTGGVEFNHVVPIIQRAAKISSLDLQQTAFPILSLPWNPTVSPPRLSALRLCGFSVSWTSPLLRNLTQLTLDCGTIRSAAGDTSVEAFLTVLGNCPDLERLELCGAGPHPPVSRRDNCDRVVQLPKLRGLFLEFANASTVACILSHVSYPESASLDICVRILGGVRVSETIPQIFAPQDTDTLRRFWGTKTLTVCVEDEVYEFSTGRSTVRLWLPGFPSGTPEPSRFATRILEITGRDITSLSVMAQATHLDCQTWEVFLRGLPQLNRLGYRYHRQGGLSQNSIDSFLLVFSWQFQGEPICPQLQRLGLPRRSLDQNPSAMYLKRALTLRGRWGRRLKQIRLSDDRSEEGAGLLFELCKDVVDEVL